MFLWVTENFTLRDTFSYMHSMLSIEFIDAITSIVRHRGMIANENIDIDRNSYEKVMIPFKNLIRDTSAAIVT